MNGGPELGQWWGRDVAPTLLGAGGGVGAGFPGKAEVRGREECAPADWHFGTLRKHCWLEGVGSTVQPQRAHATPEPKVISGG